MRRETIDDPRWQRIVARDKSADGNFWHSVSTSGVYCRPSCPSRAKPVNVTIHDSLELARASGARPCKRCRPDGRPESVTGLGGGRGRRAPGKSAGNPVAVGCEVLWFTTRQTALGAVLVALSGRGVAAILLGDEPRQLERDLEGRFPDAVLLGVEEQHGALVAGVVDLVERPSSRSAVPLDLRGTPFQLKVWQALSKIPAGRTATYSEVAALVGAPGAARAVAGACAANRLAVAIPCHRVVRSDGSLSGYRWGAERKRMLIDLEAAA